MYVSRISLSWLWYITKRISGEPGIPKSSVVCHLYKLSKSTWNCKTVPHINKVCKTWFTLVLFFCFICLIYFNLKKFFSINLYEYLCQCENSQILRYRLKNFKKKNCSFKLTDSSKMHSPVDLSCRIPRLHLWRGERPLTLVRVLVMTLSNLMVNLQ